MILKELEYFVKISLCITFPLMFENKMIATSSSQFFKKY